MILQIILLNLLWNLGLFMTHLFPINNLQKVSNLVFVKLNTYCICAYICIYCTTLLTYISTTKFFFNLIMLEMLYCYILYCIFYTSLIMLVLILAQKYIFSISTLQKSFYTSFTFFSIHMIL